MTPGQLLAHFDRISVAPDAIPDLRLFLLNLAVRGKLLEQRFDHESVDETYASLPVTNELPKNWRWLSFRDFCDIQGGNQPPKSQFIGEPRSGYVRLFQIRDLGESPVPTYIPKESTNRFCHDGEILIGRYGASVGKIFWAREGAYNVALAKFIYPANAFTSSFAFLVLKSTFFQAKLVEATRSAQAGFNKGDLASIDFPLPPLAEQRRIVAKVDELMALCDQLEAAQAERERRRDRLAAASLARLHQPADAGRGEEFRNHVRFHLDHLPRLTTRPEQIPAIRQTILNLAVCGRLVSQNSDDEPAGKLLLRIKQETNDKLSPRITDRKEVDAPFALPMGWEWTQLGCLAIDADSGWSPKTTGAPRSANNWGVLKVSAVSWDRFLPEENKELLPGVEPPPNAIVRSGDFLMSRANTSVLVAKCVVVEKAPSNLILSDKIVRLELTSLCNHRYVSIVNNHWDHSRAYYANAASGTSLSMKNVSRPVIYGLRIPLPPLAEQHRIVAKVDELIAICDELESRLTTAQTQRRRLLEAVLHEALQPVLSGAST